MFHRFAFNVFYPKLGTGTILEEGPGFIFCSKLLVKVSLENGRGTISHLTTERSRN